MPRARVGVVLPVPPAAAAEIDGLRRALGGGAVGRVHPHITLVPPLNLGLDDLDGALDVVRAAAAGTAPFAFELGPPATFWPVTPVVYLPIGGDGDAVARLHAAVNRAPLTRPTTRPFVPHVTLAENVAPDLIAGSLTALAAYRLAVTVTSVQVLEEAGDRAWRPIADIDLAGQAVVARGGLEVEIETGAVLPGVAATGAPFAVTARREGRVVGGARGCTDGDELWLDALHVEPAVRGQGVGGHLLRAVEGCGRERGCRWAFAVCPADGDARVWLGAHGWVADVQLPGWRDGRAYVRTRRGL